VALDRAALAKETAELYALPAAEYTAARKARAKALRASDPELAAAVAKVQKPSAAGAAANQLAREQPSEVRELIEAGKRLRQAQEAAVSGQAADLGAAVVEHRAALERIQREARRLRLSDAVLERAVRTVRAASIDPELQPLLERGLLADEAEPAGFGLDPALVLPGSAPARKARPSSSGGKSADRERRAAAKKRVRAAEGAVAQAKRDARAAEQELARAEGAATAARQSLEATEATLLEAFEEAERL